MCLGMHFAKSEARIVLARLVQKYDVQVRSQKLVKSPLMQVRCDFKVSERED